MAAKTQAVRRFKTVTIGGVEFKYKTSSSLIRKIWSEARDMGKSIRDLNEQRETLLKAYRDLHWKQQLNWCERNGPDRK